MKIGEKIMLILLLTLFIFVLLILTPLAIYNNSIEVKIMGVIGSNGLDSKESYDYCIEHNTFITTKEDKIAKCWYLSYGGERRFKI